jgi:hypothetical protein
MAVTNPEGAWVHDSVARVSRSIKRGEEVNHPSRDPGQDVLEKVYGSAMYINLTRRDLRPFE